MKCVCGYEHESGLDMNTEWQENLIGDEAFIQSKTEIKIYEGYGEYNYKSIFICPKCGTLKIDL